MKSGLKGALSDCLFALTIFIIVLLLFESRIVLPVWLQPFGRMHPLFLHFPIVILLIAMGMEFFRFSSTFKDQELYQNFTTNLLLIGALSSSITVIMGLFLSHEEGYSGAVLLWHKWAGVGITLFASLIYWSRKTKWYKAPVAKASTFVIFIGLVLTGHYGAVLTHGENFILQPLAANQEGTVPLEQALVFDHVVQPILEKKCASCHNPEKIKGELILTDQASLVKGGKTGPLFVAGKPEISLLLQRVHLPETDKKRMPPVGKTQLTPDEMALLALWVKENASFTKKVAELAPNDSLRIIASNLLQPQGAATETYDFAAADEETIKKLNNDYRTVAILARDSPALAVNIYNKDTYSGEKLKELDEIKKQVVALSLSKMPVKDGDLKELARFENLRRLNLNFTEITGQGLKEISALKHLNHLSISGTKVSFNELKQQIGSFKSLKSISVWNTGLKDNEISELQKQNRQIEFIAGFKASDSPAIKLNTPQIKGSTLFKKTLALELKHPIKNVEIRFTTDGTDPDSLTSPIFNNTTVLTHSTKIKAKAFKEGWYSSDVITFDFYKGEYIPDSVSVLLPLNSVHKANGPNSYFDGKLGTFNANSPAWATNWLGVFSNDMALLSEFKKPVTVSSVELRSMVEPATSIFPPESIEVWGGSSRTELKLIGSAKMKPLEKDAKPILKAYGCQFKPQTVAFIKIVAKPTSSIPEWHGNKGGRALLLVDEIFIN